MGSQVGSTLLGIWTPMLLTLQYLAATAVPLCAGHARKSDSRRAKLVKSCLCHRLQLHRHADDEVC